MKQKGTDPTDNHRYVDEALFLDFYQLMMAASYYYSSYHRQKETKGIFEMFVRKLPNNRSYFVVAGLQQVIDFVLKLGFDGLHISYLKSLRMMEHLDHGEEFFDYLRKFKFAGDIWAVPEGTILFPNEPIFRVEAPIIEAQIIETYILSMINFQSLIATKASRITSAAKGKPVIEFGSRRAHGPHAGFLAARAAYIGGCNGTSNTLAGYKLGIPVYGTLAHSFIMSFEREEEAFEQFSNVFPSSFLLVDTYDTIAAIRKIIRLGIKPKGIRIDSGDLYLQSMEARNLLDHAEGQDKDRDRKYPFTNTKIMVSGDLNEYIIRDLVAKNAPIDIFAVGTELSTSRDDPAMNGVYKLVAVAVKGHQEYESEIISSGSVLPGKPLVHTDQIHQKKDHSSIYAYSDFMLLFKLKTSPGKRTYPGPKQIYRVLEKQKDDNNTHYETIKEDVITLTNESSVPENSSPLLKKYLERGNLICQLPPITSIQNYHLSQLKILPDHFKVLDVIPDRSPVKYSEGLQTITTKLQIQ
jgi:nicotinate phosphoribosyltransferase